MERPLTISLWGEAWRLESASLRTIIVLNASVKLKSSWCWTCSFMFEEWLHIRLWQVPVHRSHHWSSPKESKSHSSADKWKREQAAPFSTSTFPQPTPAEDTWTLRRATVRRQEWEPTWLKIARWRWSRHACSYQLQFRSQPEINCVAICAIKITLKTVSQHEFWQ